jgi:hypothetical protein
MQSANMTNGILVLTWRPGSTTAGANNNTRYYGYTFNLDTGAIIAKGSTWGSGNQWYPIGSGSWGNSNYNFGNIYGNVANIAVQNKPYGNYFATNSMRTDGTNPGSQSAIFTLNATQSNATYQYWGVSVDAAGTFTNQGSVCPGYQLTAGNGPMGPRFSSDMTSTGNTAVYTTKACHGPIANSTNNPWYFFISEIKSSKPTIYMPYAQPGVGFTYATLPTGFVFDVANACPIQWIEETSKLRIWGSNGTAITYIDCTWDNTAGTLTFPATATVVASSGGSTATINTITAPVYTAADVHYNTTAASTTSGVTSSYAYSASYSVPEPYVPILKANNGMKFQLQATAVTTTASTSVFDNTQNYNPWGGPGTTFQFKRVSSGGTEYYNYTTSAWTSSVVNNAQSLFPNGSSYVPPFSSTGYFLNDIQGTWADNTSYVYSYVFTDAASITYTSGTRTIATPAVQAAPTSPTPRRMFVYTLQNRTSSHVLSVENRVLINKINLVNQSANSVTVTLNLGGYNFLSSIALAPYQTAQYETAVIANVAERLLVTCNADASVDMWVMGTEGV